MMMRKIEAFIHNCLDNRKLRLCFFVCSLASIFAVIFVMNLKTPLLGDDLTYEYIFNSSERIHSFSDIVQSQYTHYYEWGGRVVVHTIAQLLLLLDPLLIDIINSLAFMALIVVIYLHINYKKAFSLSLLLGIFFLLWFLLPFAETVLWITGSANYLWGTVIILSFLLPFRLYTNKSRGVPIRMVQAFAMFLFGIIAGWTNENTGAALLLMIILFFFNFRAKGWRNPIWIYSAFVGVLIGYILMIIAPGNAVRGEGTETNLFVIGYRLFRHTQALLNIVGLLNLAFVILLFFFLKEKKDGDKNIFNLSMIYLLGTLSAIYVMIFSPAFPERAWFGVICFNIIALGLILVNMESQIVRYIKYAFITLGLLVFGFNFYDVNKELNRVQEIMHNREVLILNSKKERKKSVNLTEYVVKSKYAISDPTYSGPSMSKHYGIEVKFIKMNDFGSAKMTEQ